MNLSSRLAALESRTETVITWQTPCPACGQMIAFDSRHDDCDHHTLAPQPCPNDVRIEWRFS
jgi:rRNA maturation endonuclease Nob1